MGKYVSQIDKPTTAQMLALAVAVNAALRGETTNTGVLEVAAGQTEVTVQDARCPSPWMRRLRQWTGGWRT